MAQGWLIAAEADIAVALELGVGFDLEVVDTALFATPGAVGDQIASAGNVGVLLSDAAARDQAFVATLHAVSMRLQSAQIILIDAAARTEFRFLPDWPAMAFTDAWARARASAAKRGLAMPELPPSRESEPPPAELRPEPQPLPEPPVLAEEAAPAPGPEESQEASTPAEASRSEGALTGQYYAPPPEPPAAAEHEAHAEPETEDTTPAPRSTSPGGFGAASAEPPAPPAQAAPPEDLAPPAPAPAATAPASVQSSALARDRRNDTEYAKAGAAPSAPADATAFAPKKLRRGTPEMVRVVIHQPKDLKAVIKAARKIDARAEPAPQSVGIGDIAIGAGIGVALEVHGAECNESELVRKTWTGDAADFTFVVTADESAKQAVLIARIFINDAQIGMIAFTRPISGPAKKPADAGDGARLKRFKRVFLSYSSQDRETVSAIATAYEMAGVEHFFDRTSLKSGEEWSPRLRKEIDKSDLFHLCWSKAAATSQWVEKEAEHALTRRQRSNGKMPAITVQMLDGPPWAPHPAALDSINFDDFVRAAIVGYARGDG